jgi:hypothetical protein
MKRKSKNKAKEPKVRYTWDFNPKSRPHSHHKGAKLYDRKQNKRIAREAY